MDNFPLSPEDQALSSAVSGEGKPWRFGKGQFDLIGALEAGYTKPEIAQHLSQKKNFNYEGASKAGYSDGEIISHLLGAGAFDAFASQFVYNMGESALGLTQAGSKIAGGEFNKKRAQAFSDAADILSEGESFAKWSGIISGSVIDPVSVPAGFLKFIKAGTLAKELAAKGSAQAIFGGLVSPTYKENWSDILAEKAEKTIVGGVFGGVLGGTLGKGIDILAKRAEGKIKAPEADIPAGKAEQGAADDALSSLIKYDQDIQAKKAASALEDVVQEVAPAETKISGKDITNKPLSGDEEKLIKDRIATLQSQVDDLRWKQAEGETPTKEEAGKQVAALFQGKDKLPEQAADNLPPVPGAGLVAPKKAEGEKPVAALFQPKPQEPSPVIQVQKDAPKVAALLRSQGIDSDIKIKQEQIRMLEQKLLESNQRKVAMEQPELVQVETRKGPAPAEAPRASAPMQAPVVATREQVTQALTRAMDETGAKSPDELIVKIGKPDEAAAAQARINAGTPQSINEWVDNAMRMQGARGSVGAAAARPETVFGDVNVFPTAEKAAKQVAQGKTAPTLKREEFSVPELEKMVQQTVGFLGKPLKQMREGGDFAGTLKGSREAGDKLIAKAQKEEGSLLGYFFKQDDEGNFVNLDKTWNRADVAAFAPVVKYAERVYNALMDEGVALRKAGKLEGAELNDLAYRLQFPVQIMGVLQGKRTEASRTLNAYKLLREKWDSGKEVKGFFSPGTPCM